MAILGYARVSVLEGDLSVQHAKLKAAGAERVFEEKKSGTSLNGRTEFEALMRFAREGDEIICTRIDRCARSVADFQKIIDDWKSRGIRFRAIDQPGVMMDGSPAADLFMNLLMAFSEFETRLRAERQADGIRAKKLADAGKPKHERTYKGRPASISADEIRRLRDVEKLGASAIARKLGIGRASVYRVMAQG
jgi:DNA invertase Pin-like site-specific DNA recombinase